MKHHLRCPVCRRDFTSERSPSQLPTHCSKRCAGRGLKRSEARRCRTCGKVYRVGKQERHAKSVLHCSMRCRMLDQPVLCKPLTPGQAGYLAGLLDGEGSIIAMKRADGTTKSYKVHIANTYLPTLHWCVAITGVGSVGMQTKHPRQPHYLPCGAYKVHGTKAASLLRRLLPYLQIKREKAQRAIEGMRP